MSKKVVKNLFSLMLAILVFIQFDIPPLGYLYSDSKKVNIQINNKNLYKEILNEDFNKVFTTIPAGGVAAGETIAAFTLAEIVITMTIIGVVAVLVIPPLVDNLQDMHFKSAMKVNFQMLSDATNQIKMDNGGRFENAFIWPQSINGTENFPAPENFFTWRDSVMRIYTRYLSYTKVVGTGDLNACGYPAGYPISVFKTLVGNNAPDLSDVNGVNSMMLSNGACMFTESGSEDCSGHCAGKGFINGCCAMIYLDVNGASGPNYFGKDVYVFQVDKELGLIPYGTQDQWYEDCNRDDPDPDRWFYNQGRTCAFKVMRGINY